MVAFILNILLFGSVFDLCYFDDLKCTIIIFVNFELMLKHLYFVFSFFSLISVSAQETIGSYNLCEGSLNVFKSGNYRPSFRGEKNKSFTFNNYRALSELKSTNQIWISFVAPEKGKVSFTAIAKETGLKFIIFRPTVKDICSEVKSGVAEIKRLSIVADLKVTGLSEEVSEGFLYPMSLHENEVIYIVLIGNSVSTEMIDFTFLFSADKLEVEQKILDFRSDEFSPFLKISIRNAETGNPVIANTAIDGGKELNGLFKGSELYFSVNRSTKMNIKCEAEGFFFLDSTEIRVFSTKSQELILNIIPVSSGKKMKLQDIDFFPGTSDITPASESRLRRLRDFLALNSTIEIEIGGHVFEPGKENSNAGQKMSEARAKRVMKYLIENGIDKSRLTAVGYGNTKPIYVEPVHIHEEQANRRVEIIVK